MNLAIFDIDGILTESAAVDEVCFVQAFRDVLGVSVCESRFPNPLLAEVRQVPARSVLSTGPLHGSTLEE